MVDKDKLKAITAAVTAFKLLTLSTDTLSGVMINGGKLDGINGTFTPNEGLALASYITPPLIYFVCSIIFSFVYTIATYDHSNPWDTLVDIGLCSSMTFGGLLYNFGDNLFSLASGRDLGLDADHLEIVMQILLLFALVFYRFIPLALTKLKITLDKEDQDDDEYYTQLALHLVSLAVDIDAIFSVITKSQRSCTMEFGTCSSSPEFTCPEAYEGFLWAAYAILLVGYIGVIVLSFIYKCCTKGAPECPDLISTVTVTVLAVPVLAFFLVADNELPLNCRHSDDPETAIQTRLGLLVISFISYSAAFIYQLLLYFYDLCAK